MSDVRELLLEAVAAHGRYKIAARNRDRRGALQGVRDSLAAIFAAGALDPSHQDVAWTSGSVRDQRIVSRDEVAYYLGYIARAVAAGL